MILAGDIALALLMEAVSPTHVKLGPGERMHDADPPTELGTVADGFDNRHGRVAIRGELWRARQAGKCNRRLEIGSPVRVVEREGLTLVVAASDR
jgi:membrane protein implicated in regulation of membrane protease activity